MDPKEPGHPEASARTSKTRQRRLLFLLAVALVAVVAIIVIVLAVRANESGTATDTSEQGDITEVTSPYDFSELPTGEDPPDVKDATYVSILLIDEAGEMISYGANAELSQAQALSEAVRAAEEVTPAGLTTASSATQGTTGALRITGSTLTFVFADRTTLTYELDLDQGLISRGGRIWKPEGDLEKLVQAIVAVGQSEITTGP